MKTFSKYGIPILVVLGLLLTPTIMNSVESARLRNEINRVASKTGITPTSVDCNNVEFAQICTAKYSSMDAKSAEQMLIDNGYTLVDQKYTRDDEVSATNTGKNVRVDSAPTRGDTTMYTLKFKDVDVTL